MLAARLILFGILIISLGNLSCAQKKDKAQSVKSDSLPNKPDSIAGPVGDTTAFTFNPENEFLGLGVPQFGDLDSMIARRRIRALVPYTHLYYYYRWQGTKRHCL